MDSAGRGHRPHVDRESQHSHGRQQGAHPRFQRAHSSQPHHEVRDVTHTIIITRRPLSTGMSSSFLVDHFSYLANLINLITSN